MKDSRRCRSFVVMGVVLGWVVAAGAAPVPSRNFSTYVLLERQHHRVAARTGGGDCGARRAGVVDSAAVDQSPTIGRCIAGSPVAAAVIR